MGKNKRCIGLIYDFDEKMFGTGGGGEKKMVLGSAKQGWNF